MSSTTPSLAGVIPARAAAFSVRIEVEAPVSNITLIGAPFRLAVAMKCGCSASVGDTATVDQGWAPAQ